MVFCLAVSSGGHGGLFNEHHAHWSGTFGNPVLPGSYVVIIWRNLSDPRLHILWLLRDGGSARPGFLFFHQSVVACGNRCEAITIEPHHFENAIIIAITATSLLVFFSRINAMRLKIAEQGPLARP
jgi:hypothetical protein